MPSRRRQLWFLLIAAALHAIVLVWFWASNPFAAHPIVDAHRYDALARDLVVNDFAYEGPYHQAPFYPYWLAALYRITPSLPLVLAVQALIAAVVVLLIHRLTGRWFGSRAATIAGVLALASGPIAMFAPRLLPTIPALALQLLWLDRLPAPGTRARAWIVPGAILGLTLLARPNVLFVGVWAIGLIVLGRVRAKSVGAMLGTAAIVVTPVTIHNLRQDEGLILISANAGETFSHGNNAAARGGYAPVAGLRSADILRQSEVAREMAEREEGRPLSAAEVQRHWFREGVSFLARDPAHAAWLTIQKARLLLGAEESPDIYSSRLEGSRYTPIFRLLVVSLPWTLPFALVGLVRRRRECDSWYVGLLVTHAITMLVFYVSNRYRAPFDVLLIPLAAAGLSLGARELRDRRAIAALASGVALVVLLVTTAEDTRRNDAGMLLTNLGTALARSGNLEDATPVFRDAVEACPGWARGHHYLGRALARQGQVPEAMTSLLRAVAQDPELAEARLDLVRALLTLGRAAEATDELRTLSTMSSLEWDVIVPASRFAEQLDLPDIARRLVVGDGTCPEARERLRYATLSSAHRAEIDGRLGRLCES